VELVVVVLIAEMRIAGGRIEPDVALRILGREHRLLEGLFRRRLALGPVVGIAAERHHQLVRGISAARARSALAYQPRPARGPGLLVAQCSS